MKKILLAIFALSTMSAQADVFFPSDVKNFINVDLEDTETVVKFSDCRVKDLKTATCTPLMKIDKREFRPMRQCLHSKMPINGAELSLGVFLTAAIIPETGGTGVILTLPLVYHSVKSAKKVIEKFVIYGKPTQNDQNFISRLHDHKKFLKQLNETMTKSLVTCDVADELQDLDKTPYDITLNLSQKLMLLKAAKLN